MSEQTAAGKYIVYKIYYTWGVAYVGRTQQNFKQRLRGHFFKKPMHKHVDIEDVTKIEVAYCKTQADMYLYEIYYINKHKPPINCDDRAMDDLTVSLPELRFIDYDCNLMEKWKAALCAQIG